MREEKLSATFSALADPTRRAILARLAAGEATVGELAEPFDLSLPTVSRHVKVLEQADLIVCERDAQWRRCRLRPEALRDAVDWLARYRAFWEGQLDALSQYLAKAPVAEAPRRPGRRPRGQRKGSS